MIKLGAKGIYTSKLILSTLRSRATQFREASKIQQTKEAVEKLKTSVSLPLLKQSSLSFTLIPKLLEREGLDDGSEELLMDALIGETCGDDDALQERMTYQEVFDSVQDLLSNQKAPYAPRTFSDLFLLKQYTAQLLKKGEYHLGRVAASQLVAKSNHIKNDGKTLARRIRALFCHY